MKLDNIREAISTHLKELHEEGFTLIRNGFPPRKIIEIKEQFQKFVEINNHIFSRHLDSDGHYPRIINLHLAFKQLMELFCANPIALGIQDGFFGRRSSIYTSLYYERGSAQPSHRDSPYFCTRPELNYLGVWVALEDANLDNGCLEVVRYGHLIPEFDRREIAFRYYETLESIPSSSQQLWDTYQEMIGRKCDELGLKREKVTAEAGDTIIWHPQLPHGGSVINDISLTRHSLVLHVTPVGVPVYGHDVFFNPDKDVPTTANWSYLEYGDRQYAAHGQIEFGHQFPTSPSAFRALVQ